MKPPLIPCENCGKVDWRPIKQHSETLGYRCKACGVGVVWNPGFMGASA
jgi:uncharacterized Zn finger protein